MIFYIIFLISDIPTGLFEQALYIRCFEYYQSPEWSEIFLLYSCFRSEDDEN